MLLRLIVYLHYRADRLPIMTYINYAWMVVLICNGYVA